MSLVIVVFAVCMAGIKRSGEDSADVSPEVKPDAAPNPPVPISALDRPAGERLLATIGASALTSFPKALKPCGVPVASALRTLAGLTGGITPNGVGTFGGPVDQPWVVLP